MRQGSQMQQVLSQGASLFDCDEDEASALVHGAACLQIERSLFPYLGSQVESSFDIKKYGYCIALQLPSKHCI